VTGNSTAHGRMGDIFASIASLRLPPSDVLELRYFFNQYESEIGIHSLHFAQFDAMAGFQNVASAWWEPEVEPRACQARRRALRVYRILSAMVSTGNETSTIVLYRMYGPRVPNARYDVFREFAPLVEFTPTVDALADRMTRALRMRLHSEAMAHLGTTDEFVRTRVRDGVRESVAPTEALRARLDRRPRRTAAMTNQQFAKLREETSAAQKEFVRTVLREAEQLLVAASGAYCAAKGQA